MKKKLLAGILSFTMLAGQVLPVVAADDVDVAVSENETVVEESAEEAAEEETSDAIEEDVIYEDVYDGELNVDQIIADLEEQNAIILDVQEKDGEIIVEASYPLNVEAPEASDINMNDQELLGATSAYYMYPSNPMSKSYNAGDFSVNGETVQLTATVDYYETIYYRARKVKPDADLHAAVRGDCGLYEVAKKLVPAGYYFDNSVIKWKFVAKKNTNALSGSTFTVKASVDTKIAKNMGIKGKSLSLLKKAVKKLNKEMKLVKKKQGIDNRIPFTIKQLVFNDIVGGMRINVVHYYGWGVDRYKFSGVYCRLEESQPETYSEKKWTKIPKKEYSYKLTTEGKYMVIKVTPKQKNVVGTMLEFSNKPNY